MRSLLLSFLGDSPETGSSHALKNEVSPSFAKRWMILFLFGKPKPQS